MREEDEIEEEDNHDIGTPDIWLRLLNHPTLKDQVEGMMSQAKAEGVVAARKKSPNPSPADYASEIMHRESQVRAFYLREPPIEVLTVEEIQEIYPRTWEHLQAMKEMKDPDLILEEKSMEKIWKK